MVPQELRGGLQVSKGCSVRVQMRSPRHPPSGLRRANFRRAATGGGLRRLELGTFRLGTRVKVRGWIEAWVGRRGSASVGRQAWVGRRGCAAYIAQGGRGAKSGVFQPVIPCLTAVRPAFLLGEAHCWIARRSLSLSRAYVYSSCRYASCVQGLDGKRWILKPTNMS